MRIGRFCYVRRRQGNASGKPSRFLGGIRAAAVSGFGLLAQVPGPFGCSGENLCLLCEFLC